MKSAHPKPHGIIIDLELWMNKSTQRYCHGASKSISGFKSLTKRPTNKRLQEWCYRRVFSSAIFDKSFERSRRYRDVPNSGLDWGLAVIRGTTPFPDIPFGLKTG